MRQIGRAVVLAGCLVASVEAQSHPLIRDARRAYDSLDFAGTIALARQATEQALAEAELGAAWQLLGFGYASLDSARQAREAFKQALFLDPDWTLDQSRISPKITSLHGLALREVLIVRHASLDSTSFVLGSGGVDLRFTVTRTARVRIRLLGPAATVTIDSTTGDGPMVVRWDGRVAGQAVAQGLHSLVIEAASGRDTYSRSIAIDVLASAVDTLPHVTSLPGYDLLPETVVPARSWRPLGIALITSAITGGAALALESGLLSGGPHRELAGVSVASIGVGLLAALRRPAPVPSEANIRYNLIVRDNIGRENQRLAGENDRRRQLVRLMVRPAPPTTSTGGQP